MCVTTSNDSPNIHVPIRRRPPNPASSSSAASAGARAVEPKRYSHVVVGYGVAGAAAVEQILALTSGPLLTDADILIIDPNAPPPGLPKRVAYVRGAVRAMDVATQHLHLEDGSSVRYKDCLIATGPGAATIELDPRAVDGDVLDHVLDMSTAASRDALADAVRRCALWPAWKCSGHPCVGSHPGTPTPARRRRAVLPSPA